MSGVIFFMNDLLASGNDATGYASAASNREGETIAAEIRNRLVQEDQFAFIARVAHRVEPGVSRG